MLGMLLCLKKPAKFLYNFPTYSPHTIYQHLNLRLFIGGSVTDKSQTSIRRMIRGYFDKYSREPDLKSIFFTYIPNTTKGLLTHLKRSLSIWESRHRQTSRYTSYFYNEAGTLLGRLS